MTERPLDRTQQSYVEPDNAAITRFFREMKLGLARLNPLELTTNRDGKGGQVVSGAVRKDRSFYKSAFGEDFLKYHERSLAEIQWMQERGRHLSPNPKTSNPERIPGGLNDEGASNDRIIRIYNAWDKFCEQHHKYAKKATLLIFGSEENHNFTSASQAMRQAGMKASDKTVKGLATLGLELYTQRAKLVDRDSE